MVFCLCSIASEIAAGHTGDQPFRIPEMQAGAKSRSDARVRVMVRTVRSGWHAGGLGEQTERLEEKGLLVTAVRNVPNVIG